MKPLRTLFCTLLLGGASAFAGTFTADFSTQDTSQFYYNGSGTLTDGSSWMPLITGNKLQLTTNQNSLSGSFSPIDFDNGSPVESFTAKFKLQFGPGTANAADGGAFSFGPDVNQYSTSYNEVGAGGAAFAVSFHTYTSNGGPAVDVYLYGTRIAHYPLAKGDMVNSQLQDVVIQMNRNSTLNVSYRGQVIATNLYLAGWGPTNGFYIISGRTGGENEETDIADVNITSTLYTTPVAPVFLSTPTNFTVAEGGSASFSATFDGTGPFAIQWLQNGNPIQDATKQTLTLSPVYYADNNSSISVQVTTPGGTITSPAAKLTIIKDVVAPTVLSATADKSFTTLVVKYSEPVSDTALIPSNYVIDQGVTISDLMRLSATTVQLTTSQLTEGSGYNLTINNVQDMATTPNTVAANTVIRFQTFQFMHGTVVHQKYTGFDDNAGSSPDNLFADPRFPNQPDRRDLLTSFEYPANGAGFNAALDSDKLFFDTMEGYFTPPTSGDYVFFIAFSDRGWLFLSTDDSPANKCMIAGTTGWSDPLSWLSSHDYDPNLARSDAFANTQWPTGDTITLEAGKKYYMLMVHHMPDWAGGSWCGATYKLASAADPANGTPSILGDSVMGAFIDPTGTSVSFTNQPQNTTTTQGRSASFSAAATGVSPYGANVNYQWQTAAAGSSTWTDIAGATTAILQTAQATMADNGRQYRMVATVPPVSQNSSVATLTVIADTVPPVPSVGAMQSDVAGTISVGVGFDETVDDATGSAIANYTVSSGTITAINWYTNRFTDNSKNPQVMIRKQNALLTVTGFSGASGTLTVKNVKDIYNNAITSVAVPFTVDTKMKWGVVGGNELGGWNAAVPVASNGWDVYSDGMTEWANYDETTFVYESVTGDFDKKLRVQYQDGSSTWARAGLIVRDVLNLGVDRAAQTGGLAGRYQKCHVNPVGAELTGPGNLGNSVWEGNRRLATGGTCNSSITNANSTPLYPNAWCRVKRVGQTFTIFRSDDGKNWVTLGTTTWGIDDPSKMPDTVYVGPEFSPENGNVTLPADQGTFLAQFRDYGDYSDVFEPQLKIARSAQGATITWAAGTLVSSPTINGPYTAVTGATSPYVITSGSANTFYQVKQ
jgi:hypothetical protein